MGSGRTRPLLVVCETGNPSDDPIETVAKLSNGCDDGVTSLAREVVASCLAGDLNLPIPEPFLIEIQPKWAAVVTDPLQRQRLQTSSPMAFGSHHLTGQYIAWTRETRLPAPAVATAAAILVFDAITQNVDRRDDNPNCLVRGDEIRIIDHEMAFTHGLVIGWRPPWLPGGLRHLEAPGSHIFKEQLRRRRPDFEPIRAAWASLSDEQIGAYGEALPDAWQDSRPTVDRAMSLIRDARDHIDACLAEVQRILR